MRSRQTLDLRGKDPTTLEVIVPDALSMPLGQLAPISVADMMALAESEAAPKRLVKDLANFSKRIAAEVADLPSGAPIQSFADDLAEIPPERVPHSLRAVVEAEIAREDKRSGADRSRLRAAAARWAEVEPEPFPLGTGRGPRVVRTEQTREAAETHKGTRRARTRSASSAPAARRTRTVATEDPEKTKWIEQQAMTRLAPYGDRGLTEMVLIAGIRHAARAEYPDLQPNEVTAVLGRLASGGRLRRSAGRWSLPGRW